MNRKIQSAILAAFLVVLCGPTSATAVEPPAKKSYAIVVAHNGSVDEGVAPLRYADDDGARFYELFSSVADEAYLLTTLDADSQRVFGTLSRKTQAPSLANLRARVRSVAEKIRADRARGIESEVYLVFTGHGNVEDGGEGYLSLADGKLRRSDIYRDVIRPLDASYTHLIIDACHAYFMVRSRGGGDWEDDRSGETLDEAFEAFLDEGKEKSTAMSTVGVILSTAGAAEVHEWSKFRAGVFSHELRSGMLGAADADGDGDVTYRELEAYLVAANAAVTNPRARIKVFAEPPSQDKTRPLVTLDDFRDSTRLVLPSGVGGRFHIEDPRGLRYLDMNVDPAGQTRIVLLREPTGGRAYYLRTDTQQATVSTGDEVVGASELAFAEIADASRGSVEEAFRTSLFATPFGPAFVQGYTAGRESMLTQETPQAERWSADASFDYTVGTPTLDIGGVQHNLSLSLDFVRDRRLGIGGYVGYGFADSEVGRFHRVSVGAQLHPMFDLDAWRVGPRLRLGHQALFLDADEVYADPVGFRAELAFVGARRVVGGLHLALIGGASVDVTTRTGVSETSETADLNPFVGVGVRF